MKKNNTVKQTSPFRYAFGMFGTSIPINMFKTYASFYYVDKLGLHIDSFSLVLLIYTFIDAIDNPVYGFLSDRTRTPWGRRKPWIILGTPLLVLSFISFFNVPSFIEKESLFSYMLLLYILTGTLDSLINANYGALFPELFKTEDLRTKTNMMRQIFQLLAMVIATALTPIITSKLGYSNTALVYGVLAGFVIIFSALGYHESKEASEIEKPKFFSSLLSIASNKKFWIYGFTNAFYSAAMSLVMGGVPFYVKYALNESDLATTILMATVLLLAILGVVVWSQIIKKKTLMPTWRGALIVLALGFIPLFFAKNLVTAVVCSSLIGFGLAGALATMDLVGARIMDDDVKRSGLRREGIYSSVSGFMNRLNGIFVSLAYFLVSRLYGYKSGENPGNNPGSAAKFLLIIFPFILAIISVVISHFLHFEEDDKLRKVK